MDIVKKDKDNLSLLDRLQSVANFRKKLNEEDLARISKLTQEKIQKKRDMSPLMDIVVEYLNVNRSGMLGAELENVLSILINLFYFIEARPFDDNVSKYLDEIIMKAMDLSKNFRSSSNEAI